MDYQVSARKWRPQTFEEVIGQKHVTTSLTNAIRHNKIAQAYLFSGIRGVGKTSLARILAKGVNCKKEGTSIPCNQCESCLEITQGHSVDVIEIDGASNTGVDDVRELRENVKYLPLRGQYKVYIIDEVHMLSNAAFNALLKTLEEPPPHLIFILATTESHKIPGTILSRCQHFTFRRMTASEIGVQLRLIIEEKNIQFTERGLNLIARAAEGSMRDALSLLDQAISFGGESVTDDDLFILLGRMDSVIFHRLIHAIHEKNAEDALSVAREIADHGCDLRQFLTDWLEYLRNLIVAQNVPSVENWVDLSKEEVDTLQKEADLFSREALQRLFSLFSRLLSEIRTAPQPALLFEVALMKSLLLADTQSVESIIEKLEAISSGKPALQTTNAKTSKPSPQNTRDTIAPPKEKQEGTPDLTKSPPSNISSAPSSPRPQSSMSSPQMTSEQKPRTTVSRDKAGWQSLLKQIKEKRPNVGSYLAEGTLDHFDQHEIRIAFSKNSAFLITLIQKADSQEWLRVFIKDQLGDPVQLVFIEKKEEKIKTQTEKTPKPSSQNDTLQTRTEHPLIQEALNIMGGTIIETKRVQDDSKSKENKPYLDEEKP